MVKYFLCSLAYAKTEKTVHLPGEYFYFPCEKIEFIFNENRVTEKSL